MATADEESFTAGRHHAIRSMTSSQVTASSSLPALAAAADAAARACLHTLNIPGRQRHSERAQKARPKFPHASATKTTVTRKPRSQYSRRDSPSPLRHTTPGNGGTAPPARGRGPWNRALPPPRHAGVTHARA